MAVYSRYPIAYDDIRTLQLFLWKDMPGALLPDDPNTPTPSDWYAPDALEVFRLSSKSHWDIPMDIGNKKVHFLVSHPTPPVFDGPEDRNGKRNFDEIRFWAVYISPGCRSRYIGEQTTGDLSRCQLQRLVGQRFVSCATRRLWLQQRFFPQEGRKKLVEGPGVLQHREMPDTVHDPVIHLGSQLSDVLLVVGRPERGLRYNHL
jgi:hypothetical protein